MRMNPFKGVIVIAGMTAVGLGLAYYISRSTRKTRATDKISEPLSSPKKKLPSFNRDEVTTLAKEIKMGCYDREGSLITTVYDIETARDLLGRPGSEPNSWHVDLALFKLNELGIRYYNLKKWLRAETNDCPIEVTYDEITDAMEELRYHFNKRYTKVKDRYEMMEKDEEMEEKRLLEEMDLDDWS